MIAQNKMLRRLPRRSGDYRPSIDVLRPQLNCVRISAAEFDAADQSPGYVYEVIDGVLHVAPAPNPREKAFAVAIFRLLQNYNDSRKKPPFGGLAWDPRVIVSHDENRLTNPQPDVAAYRRFASERSAQWADVSPELVVAVVAPHGHEEDYIRNVELYTRVPSIREYWIIDPTHPGPYASMTVHRRLRGDQAFVRLDVPRGGVYESKLYKGLCVDLRKLVD